MSAAAIYKQARPAVKDNEQVVGCETLLEECKAVLCRLGLCHPGCNAPDDQAMDQCTMLAGSSPGTQKPLEEQHVHYAPGAEFYGCASSSPASKHMPAGTQHQVQTGPTGCYSHQPGKVQRHNHVYVSQDEADYQSARDQLEPHPDSSTSMLQQHASASMPVAKKGNTGLHSTLLAGSIKKAASGDDGSTASMHSMGSWDGRPDDATHVPREATAATATDVSLDPAADTPCEQCPKDDARGYWGSHDGQALQLGEHGSLEITAASPDSPMDIQVTVAAANSCEGGHAAQEHVLLPACSPQHMQGALQCHSSGGALDAGTQQHVCSMAEMLLNQTQQQDLPPRCGPTRKRGISCSEGGGTAVRPYPRLDTYSVAGYSTNSCFATNANHDFDEGTPSKLVALLCSSLVEPDPNTGHAVMHTHTTGQQTQRDTFPYGGQLCQGFSSHAGRPAVIPRLNLSKLSSGEAVPPALQQPPHHHQQAHGMIQCGIELEAGDDEDDDELARWAAPAIWLPNHQGRHYIYTPVSSKMVQQSQQLRAALPAHLASHLDDMWNSLIEARYACEQIASRGVRVAKDITREWSEISSQLIERIETAEAATADMRAHCEQQAALVHHLSCQLKLAQQVAVQVQSQASAASAYQSFSAYYPAHDMVQPGQLLTSPTPSTSYYTSPLHSSSTILHSPSLIQPLRCIQELPANAMGHPGACMQHVGSSGCVYLGTTTTGAVSQPQEPTGSHQVGASGACWAAPSLDAAHGLSCHHIPLAPPLPLSRAHPRRAERGGGPGGGPVNDAATNLLQQRVLAAQQVQPTMGSSTFTGGGSDINAGACQAQHAADCSAAVPRMAPAVEVYAMGYEEAMVSHSGYSMGDALGAGYLPGMLQGMPMSAQAAWGQMM